MFTRVRNACESSSLIGNDTELMSRHLLLEYVGGGELFDRLVNLGRLGADEASQYFQQIISGVSYCHHFNIAHRDLKPENLLIDAHNRVKVADFGLAALQQPGRLLQTSCGSPHYASPEIVSVGTLSRLLFPTFASSSYVIHG